MANQNAIITDTWSNPDSEALYRNEWPDEPAIRAQKLEGDQCGGCSYFAPFNLDFGLCCHPASRHFSETVFEHFTCPVLLAEGWGAHSFGAIELDEK
ncbi:MAG TPA: hypothetical protein VE974_10845 [Thermoanaerobaculia bacterium]|nr:hypothetical protein [Thermoanaerobaculia bacterium]